MEKYYKEKKQIRGRDIFYLLDISEITKKFEEIVAENPFFDDYDEEADDLDNRDTFGDDL